MAPFNLQSAESLITLLSLGLAYLVTVTTVGVLRAWTSYKMGDYTAVHMGYGAFNPARHVDPIGAFLLLIFGIGWGRDIPINPLNITGKYHRLKMAMAYLSGVFIHLAFAITTLITLFLVFGEKLSRNLIIMPPGVFTLGMVAKTFGPESSSMLVALALVLITIIYLNALLVPLNLIVNGFQFAMVLYLDSSRYRQSGSYNALSSYSPYMVFVPIILIFLFYDFIWAHARILIHETAEAIVNFIKTFW